jgi:hypothetical protein
MTKSGGRKPTTPLTLILCRKQQRRLADSAPPKGRGNGSNARLAPPRERPAPRSFAGMSEGELNAPPPLLITPCHTSLLHAARCHHGLGHTVQDFLVGGTDGGKDATQTDRVGHHEVVWAQPHTRAERARLITFEIDVLRVE